MIDFHFICGEKVLYKIDYLKKLYNFRSRQALINNLFENNAIKFMKFGNSLNFNRYSLKIDNDIQKEVHLSIPEIVHSTVKLLHKTFNTFSMALVFRSMIDFATDFVMRNGLEKWFIFLNEVIYECDNREKILLENTVSKFVNKFSNFNHMDQIIYKKNQKIVFFDRFSNYLTYINT